LDDTDQTCLAAQTSEGDVPRADWQILFVISVVNTYARRRNGLRAVGDMSCVA
jgi:hypothetical protein